MKKYVLLLLVAANLFALNNLYSMQQDKTEKTQSIFSEQDIQSIEKAFKDNDQEASLTLLSRIIRENDCGSLVFSQKMMLYDQILHIIYSSKNKNTDCYTYIKNYVKKHLLTCIYNKTKIDDDIEFKDRLKLFSNNYTLERATQKHAWYKNYIPYLYIFFCHLKTENYDKETQDQVAKAIEKTLEKEDNVKLKEKFFSEFYKEIISVKKNDKTFFEDFVELAILDRHLPSCTSFSW